MTFLFFFFFFNLSLLVPHLIYFPFDIRSLYGRSVAIIIVKITLIVSNKR